MSGFSAPNCAQVRVAAKRQALTWERLGTEKPYTSTFWARKVPTTQAWSALGWPNAKIRRSRTHFQAPAFVSFALRWLNTK